MNYGRIRKEIKTKGILMENHVVYIGRIKDEIVYVGHGKYGRQDHLNSGVSHLYQANKAHFKGLVIDIELHSEGISKEEAVETERKLIQELNPLWNTALTPKSELRLSLRKHLSKFDTSRSSRLSILKAGMDNVTDDGVMVFKFADVMELSNLFSGFYKGFTDRKSPDPMFEYIERRVRPNYEVKLRDDWLKQLEINLYELKRKAL